MVLSESKKNTSYLIGIEREVLRCDESGALVGTMHPEEFGDKMENMFITNDFGEAHIEIRTEALENPDKCYKDLANLHMKCLKYLIKEMNIFGHIVCHALILMPLYTIVFLDIKMRKILNDI